MKRPLAVIGFTLFGTLLALNYVPNSLHTYVVALLVVSIVVALAVPCLRKNSFLLCVLCTGVFSCIVNIANYNINIKPVEEYNRRNCKVYGKIVEEPNFKNNQYSYIMDVESVDDLRVKKFKTQITSGTPLECELYDYFTCNVNFYTPNSTNYFDSRTYFKSKGIYIVAYFDNSKITQTALRKDVDLWYNIIKIRERILYNSKLVFNEEISSIENAILLGEKNKISNENKILFTKNGIYHLFVTSGTHMAIICSGLFWLFKRFRLSKKIFAVISIVVIVLFVSATCFNLATVRSGIMFIIYLLGLIFQRKHDQLNSLGVAVFLICIFNPLSALSMGLLFSILSILGIIFFYNDVKSVIIGIFNDKFSKNPIINYVADSMAVSISASIITMPIVAIYFKVISIIFVISNLILLPIITVIIFLSVLLTVGGIINIDAFSVKIVSNMLKFIINVLLYLSRKLSVVPFCYINVNYRFLWVWSVISLGIVFVSVVIVKNRKFKLFSNLACVVLLISYIIFNNFLNHNSVMVSATKCGNGVGLIISNNNHNAVLLCSNSNLQIDRFESLLNLSNIDSLDYLTLAYCNSYPIRFLKNTSNCFNLNTLLLPENYDIKLSDKILKKLVTFGEEADVQFFSKNASANVRKINGKTYVLLKVLNKNILVLPTKYKINDIPIEWRKIDILLADSLSSRFSKLEFKNVILYGSQYKVDKTMMYKPNNNVEIYKLYFYGTVNLKFRNESFEVEG